MELYFLVFIHKNVILNLFSYRHHDIVMLPTTINKSTLFEDNGVCSCFALMSQMYPLMLLNSFCG